MYRTDEAPCSCLRVSVPFSARRTKVAAQARRSSLGRRNDGRHRLCSCQPGWPSPRSGPCRPLRAADPLPRPGSDRSKRGKDRGELAALRGARLSRTAARAGPGTGAGLRRGRFRIEVSEDLLDHHRILDAGDDAHRPAAHRAGVDVDVEYPLQALRPSHRRAALVGAFTQRNESEPSGRSRYTPSRNSMWKCRLRLSAGAAVVGVQGRATRGLPVLAVRGVVPPLREEALGGAAPDTPARRAQLRRLLRRNRADRSGDWDEAAHATVRRRGERR
jgi:hypothetical protein